MFCVQSGLIQGYALSPLLFSISSEYAVRKVKENQVETSQLALFSKYN
jgi:hypothetical protein